MLQTEFYLKSICLHLVGQENLTIVIGSILDMSDMRRFTLHTCSGAYDTYEVFPVQKIFWKESFKDRSIVKIYSLMITLRDLVHSSIFSHWIRHIGTLFPKQYFYDPMIMNLYTKPKQTIKPKIFCMKISTEQKQSTFMVKRQTFLYYDIPLRPYKNRFVSETFGKKAKCCAILIFARKKKKSKIFF